MADYYQLIARAVAGLGKNTDKAWRAALYARARGALVIELCRITPPLSEPEITPAGTPNIRAGRVTSYWAGAFR